MDIITYIPIKHTAYTHPSGSTSLRLVTSGIASAAAPAPPAAGRTPRPPGVERSPPSRTTERKPIASRDLRNGYSDKE